MSLGQVCLIQPRLWFPVSTCVQNTPFCPNMYVASCTVCCSILVSTCQQHPGSHDFQVVNDNS